jgi:transcriptional regulator with XRE-family HTH domain
MGTPLGSFLKRHRLKAGFGLRRFAELVEIQPSNWSAMEHGRRPLPDDPEKLRQIAEALGLSEGSSDWEEFFDEARKPGQLPADVRHLADRELVPALLRTIDNRNLTDGEIEKLIREVQGE